MTYFFLVTYHKRHSIIQNLFQKVSIFKAERSSSEIWDCQWHKTFSVTPVLTVLTLLPFFQIIKMRQCCGFTFTNFFFFLTSTNALSTSRVTFSNTRIFFVFFLLFDLLSHGSLMEINSTHMYFRSRIMLCFDDEKQKDKNTFRDNSQSEHFIY